MLHNVHNSTERWPIYKQKQELKNSCKATYFVGLDGDQEHKNLH